jgi:hypothetical protein
VFVGAMVKNKSKTISRIDDKDKGTQSITNQNIVVGIVILTALCIGLYFNKSNFVSDKISVNADVGVQSKFDELEQQNSRKQLFIESNFVNFSYAKLGGKVGEYFAGDKLEIDGGPYFFTKNKARINYSYDEKISYEKQGLDQKIIAIIFSCKESIFPISEGLASIDGVSCYSELSKLENSEWKKSCSVYSFNNLSKPLDILFTKNNAAIQVKFDEMSSPSIDQIGLYSDISRFNTGYRSCDEAEKLKYKAIQGGFKSLGDMMSK